MNQNTQFELSLGILEGIVKRLLESCSIDESFVAAAQEANIATIKLLGLYERPCSQRVYSEEEPPQGVRTYRTLIRSCLIKFQGAISDPSLNGQRLPLELCREQMLGRLILINRMYPARYQG